VQSLAEILKWAANRLPAAPSPHAISALRRAFNFGYLDYPERRDPAEALKCSRIGKKDRPLIDPFSIQDAEVLIAAIHREWGELQGNYDELRFFTGLRPSEQIALVVTDYDRRNGVLSVTKARVHGIDQDVTKTREDRRVVLGPRAIAVLERHLTVRERWSRAGLFHHAHLFFAENGTPIRDAKYPYGPWHRTLTRLAIRYRKPYAARHTSVSWNLMVGHNPLWVARQHGHRIATMLSAYAAWAEGAREEDIAAIWEAMNGDGPNPCSTALNWPPRCPRAVRDVAPPYPRAAISPSESPAAVCRTRTQFQPKGPTTHCQ
jgi:integrase